MDLNMHIPTLMAMLQSAFCIPSMKILNNKKNHSIYIHKNTLY